MDRSSVLIEADGGSRGNPGPAAYGAVLKDLETGEVLAEVAATIGVATNNVAEYQGLIAGLELYAEHATGARLEVRMDSKLVVEQMSGRWRIKHPDLKPLAQRAAELTPPGTSFTWIPREQNTHADRILNEALDGKRTRRTVRDQPKRGWAEWGTPTTLLLVRHGVTKHTTDKRLTGGLAGHNLGLTDEGREQARATADWLAPLAESIDRVVSSPVRRTHETAEILAARLDKELDTEDGLAEMEFGSWEGMTFAEVRDSHPDDLDEWLGSLDVAPGRSGESLRTVEKRVLASLDLILSRHAGQTLVLISHVTPIKVLVADALGAPLEAVFRMELAPASVTVLSYYADPSTGSGARSHASMRLFNARPTDADLFGR